MRSIHSVSVSSGNVAVVSVVVMQKMMCCSTGATGATRATCADTVLKENISTVCIGRVCFPSV